MPLNIKVDGVTAARKKLRNLSKKAASRIKKQTSRSALKIETDAKDKCPVDTGRLRASIQTKITENGFVAIIMSDVRYAPTVEYGREAGSMPPIEELEGWAQRHNIKNAYVVARKIGEKGTDAQPFLKPAFEDEEDNYVSKVKKALKKMEG